jgi:integrase
MTDNPFEDRDLEHDPFETDQTAPTVSKENALEEDEFERLLEGASRLDDLYDLEARFVILLAGRLGMRAGEIRHIKKDWVDFDKDRIHVPAHEPCDMGKDGEICGSCKQSARQMAETNDVKYEEIVELFWKAKTAEAERDVPYGWSDQCKEVIETFFDRFEEYYGSQSSINRRVDQSLKSADDLDTDATSPHGLRATAATYHAGRGLNYVVYAGERVEQSLDGIHNEN